MPGPSIQEQDVSGYWAANYDPVMDFAYEGTYGIETNSGIVYGTMVGMTDGSVWFDHDNDGWFDVGRRYDETGNVEEYTGSWRKLPGEEMETIDLQVGGSGSDWLF